MKLVLQRVVRAAVVIEERERRPIGPGLVILAGFHATDSEETCLYMANKAVNLRIFDDQEGNMNRSLLEVGGDCLVVSQFTLYANSRKGRRPSFIDAAQPAHSQPMYEEFVHQVRRAGVGEVVTGKFGAEMKVDLINDGPVTIILDSDEIMPGKGGAKR